MEDINVYVDLRYQNKWIREAFENKDMALRLHSFKALTGTNTLSDK